MIIRIYHICNQLVIYVQLHATLLPDNPHMHPLVIGNVWRYDLMVPHLLTISYFDSNVVTHVLLNHHTGASWKTIYSFITVQTVMYEIILSDYENIYYKQVVWYVFSWCLLYLKQVSQCRVFICTFTLRRIVYVFNWPISIYKCAAVLGIDIALH